MVLPVVYKEAHKWHFIKEKKGRSNDSLVIIVKVIMVFWLVVSLINRVRYVISKQMLLSNLNFLLWNLLCYL